MQTMRPLSALSGMLAVGALAACGTTADRLPAAPPAAAAAVTTATSGEPATTGPAPGQWQLVLEVDDLRGTGKVPPQTMTLCSTPEDKKQWQDMVGGKTAAGCSVRDYTASGATISYAMQCGGGIEGRTTIRIADADHYAGESTLTMRSGPQPAVIRSKVTATRVSPTCRK
jgi:hypothetical protein